MTRQPTRADVARHAGVSPAVVSYVINNGPRPVSAAARARVNDAIDALAYRPNQVARALRANRSRSIGLLLPDALNPFFGELAQRVESYCIQYEYLLFVGTTNNDPTIEQHYVRAFEDRQVDGLIVVSTTERDEEVATRLPTIYVDRSPTRSLAATAHSPSIAGGCAATSHLLREHHRTRILVIAGPQHLASTVGRVTGALEAIDSVPGASATIRHAAFDYRSGYDAVTAAVQDGTLFDAVFALSDVQAVGAIRACADLGLAVPEQVSVVAFDGTELTRYTTPRVTTIAQDVDLMASNALTALLRQIDTTSAPGDTESPPASPSLRLGDSCGCHPEMNAPSSAKTGLQHS